MYKEWASGGQINDIAVKYGLAYGNVSSRISLEHQRVRDSKQIEPTLVDICEQDILDALEAAEIAMEKAYPQMRQYYHNLQTYIFNPECRNKRKELLDELVKVGMWIENYLSQQENAA